ncbi:Uncharacterized protein FWK35_00031218 [Aphis craccivora]|uniref:Uncharacterized protein n=1 Tax=Aphis craccivora TaxID=307492 RepID=A0A6G0YL09_APHCR|nr:Uncharacterized protein FWK35_00031218 [Aphis craccivora]
MPINLTPFSTDSASVTSGEVNRVAYADRTHAGMSPIRLGDAHVTPYSRPTIASAVTTSVKAADDRSVNSWTSAAGGIADRTPAGDSAVSSGVILAGFNELRENGGRVKTTTKSARAVAGI